MKDILLDCITVFNCNLKLCFWKETYCYPFIQTMYILCMDINNMYNSNSNNSKMVLYFLDMQNVMSVPFSDRWLKYLHALMAWYMRKYIYISWELTRNYYQSTLYFMLLFSLVSRVHKEWEYATTYAHLQQHFFKMM